MRRFKRLLVAEILDKGLDPTVAYSELDKNGKLKVKQKVLQKEEDLQLEKVEESTSDVQIKDEQIEITTQEKVEDQKFYSIDSNKKTVKKVKEKKSKKVNDQV
jgi:hypothetical protein